MKKGLNIHSHLIFCVLGTCWCDWTERWQRNSGSNGELDMFKAFVEKTAL